MPPLIIDNQTIEFRVTPLENIFQLRWDILRPGLPEDAAQFDGDDEPTTLHFGAFTEDGRNVGCCTYVVRPWVNDDPRYPDFPGADPAATYQLRGMATAPDLAKRGIGTAMQAFAERTLSAAAAQLLWCNARVHAVPFYQRLGWRVASDEFHIPTVGPHHKMTRPLNGATDPRQASE
ncbi:MAG: GNAT family N-acetyltransferase [Planctomycetota bacterium]|jgi:GNAT superfamily N-acetyltransferase